MDGIEELLARAEIPSDSTRELMDHILSGLLKNWRSIRDDFSARGAEYRIGRTKRTLDILGTVALMAPAVPLGFVAGAGIAVTDGLPIIYKEARLGRGGTEFNIFKFRSMYNGALHRVEPKSPADDRVTRIGNKLRKGSIDELPQVINILFGSMSLVGPRPVPVRELRLYQQAANFESWFEDYKKAKPGLTGLAQVNGRNLLTPAERMDFDQDYASNASLKLDLEILLKTIEVAVTTEGAF